MIKRPFRATRKDFVKLEEARASKLLKAVHIEIWFKIEFFIFDNVFHN